MPELPEVEVLVRHLQPLVRNRIIRSVEIRRVRVIAPTPLAEFQQKLHGAKILDLSRRGKYLRFQIKAARDPECFTLLGHLGMTGRMFVARNTTNLPKHAAVVLGFGRERFVYEDPRYFGKLSLDDSALAKLGPEPLEGDFTVERFATDLKRSHRPIKIKLLDQSLLAGVGNIYASEALYRARISPRLAACRLSRAQVRELRRSIRSVLSDAIRCGSTIPLRFDGGSRDGLFYFGSAPGAPDYYQERLRVYDRQGQPCLRCQTPIRRMVQAARSTFYCPECQRASIRLR